ncbi:ArsR/SmtB family transcription factor [Neolewinella litorea]|uniref:ArsR family transcriptional regulator n=1 Tax=Neolewinella litorea TaxID=2562452 RepID=A0A4S4NIS7_9BACT|nr:metalloregulator ArsR/SmtB family transcription factor [Neolewinella litorea]THH39676.1 ArsR family transcriptional regulator [Neolewinella litorea]
MGVTKTEAYTEAQLQMAGWYKALGHPARIAILEHLLEQDCCICQDLTEVIDLSQPSLSRHLGELRDAGLIVGSTAGNSRSYCINPARWREVQAALNGLFNRFRDGTC